MFSNDSNVRFVRALGLRFLRRFLTVLTKVSVGLLCTKACEHAFVMYADALLLLFELADREDERFQQAAARWHARFVLAGGRVAAA